VLTVKGGEVLLKDLGSKNHTYIDQRKISSEVKIKEGTHIGFGLLKARLLKKPGT
jgi:pSer/pThr/pTyr-binding forkhead associated (FHA) protein